MLTESGAVYRFSWELLISQFPFMYSLGEALVLGFCDYCHLLMLAFFNAKCRGKASYLANFGNQRAMFVTESSWELLE